MKIKFMPQNREVEIGPNQTVLEVAQKNGIKIHSVCKGVPSCAECRVRVTEGEYNLLPPNAKELELIGTLHFVDNSRLACQLRCFGDITVDLSEQIQKTERAKAKRSKALWAKAGGDKKKDNDKDKETEEQPLVAEADDVAAEITREDDYLTAEEILYEAEKRRELERIKRQKKGE
jgi:2Fe-2S ferredoxin